MKIIEGYFIGSGGVRLFYRCGLPDGPVTGTLIILHGHGEHFGRYQKFFVRVAKPGLAIAGFDFRGHGKSEGPRVFVKTLEEYIEDISAFIRDLEITHGLKGKVIVLGHSFGGLSAVHWTLRFPDLVKGLILSSPCLGLRVPGILRVLNRFLYCVAPRFLYQKPVYPPHLTHNPDEVANYGKDVLIQRKISVSLIYQVLLYMRRLEEIPSPEFPFPVFILAAEQEKVVDLQKTKVFFEKLKAPVKELQIFPGFYHEIFNELKQDEAFTALNTCLDRIRA